MPELPDVESFRKYARRLLDKKIITVKIMVDSIIKTSESTLRKHLLNNKLVSTGRHGKYLFLKISDGYFLVVHFGMTGSLSYYENEKPEHPALILELSNNHNFSINSVRKFGEINITESKREYIKNKGLGPDALSLKQDEFMSIIKKHKGMIKTFLMNQHLIAGIGNVYADEILFQSRIHPETNINELKVNDYENIYSKTMSILKTAVKNNADPEKMPSNYLLRIRKKNNKCPLCLGRIQKISVGGRPTYYCSKHQKN